MAPLWALLPDDQLVELLSWCTLSTRRTLAATCHHMSSLVPSEEVLHVRLQMTYSVPPTLGPVQVEDDKFVVTAVLHQRGTPALRQLADLMPTFLFPGDIVVLSM